jgi:hypothetical protein
MRAPRKLEGKTARGYLRVYLGIILVAEVSIAIPVDTQKARLYGEASSKLETSVSPYRKIFASYSHADEAIVRQFEQLVDAFGDKYLRDVRDIRAGEKWDERLEELIREADVFQLFWSRNSMRSKFVRDEWEYALSLNKHNFIRPTFWEEPMPEDKNAGLPPTSLLSLQFKRVPIRIDEPPSGKAYPPPPPTTPSYKPTYPTGSEPVPTLGGVTFCDNCGSKMEAGENFCRQCGRRSGHIAEPSIPDATLDIPGPSTAPQQTQEPNFYDTGAGAIEPPSYSSEPSSYPQESSPYGYGAGPSSSYPQAGSYPPVQEEYDPGHAPVFRLLAIVLLLLLLAAAAGFLIWYLLR